MSTGASPGPGRDSVWPWEACCAVAELPRWVRYKESACNAGGLGSILWLERAPGEMNGNPLQLCFPVESP